MQPDLRQKCQDVLDRIKDRETSIWFMDPVDPIEDNAPGYFDVIKRPSDLGTVQEKLSNNKYKTVLQFKEDLSLIWSNCIKFNGEKSLMGSLAADLKQYSDKHLAFLSDSPEIDWLNELVYLVEELSDAVKIASSSSSGQKRRSSSSANIKQLEFIIEESDEVPNYNYEQIEQLGKDITSMEKEEDIQAMYNCLKEVQPRLVGDKTNLTLNLCTLSPATLQALMLKRDEIFNKAENADNDKAEYSSQQSSLESDSPTTPTDDSEDFV